MPLLQLTDVHLAYGPQVLLESATGTIERGDRCGVLGRNGAGKTSFLRLLAGTLQPDSGEVWRRPGIRVATLDQSLPAADSRSVFDFVAGGLARTGELLAEFQVLSATAPDRQDLARLAEVQKQIEAADGWLLQQKVESMLSFLALPADQAMESLSGGWLRRAALARALVGEPDILLLDEPTNHLDIPMIEWLEKWLQAFRGALVLITHDRAFLQKVANRIMELDRGMLHDSRLDYRRFLAHRRERLAAEEKANREFDRRLAREEAWIREGIKARRTRNQGRVRALQEMREAYRARRVASGRVNMQANEAEKSGKLVAEAEHVSHAFGGRPVVRDFSSIILRGDRIGLIGPNGAGKTTLLKILLGQLTPDAGRVRLGTRLEVAYFDQLRSALEGEASVLENLAPGREYVELQGKRRHVMSYLQDFLFTPDRARQPVRTLSGGEQNRLLLAQLFSRPANVLVMDEPTNDLDLETLELLEEMLLEFDGTLLLVSHDRAFLDNVVTSSIIFEGEGRVSHRPGGYEDWLNAGGGFPPVGAGGTDREERGDKPAPMRQQRPKARKLSYKLQRELADLPKRIEKAEARVAELEQRIADPGFYRQDHTRIETELKALSSAQAELDRLFERWEELEGQQ